MEQGVEMRRVVNFGILVLSGCSLLFGQSGSLGSIEGNVLDPAGAVIPGARITATSTDTGSLSTSVSNPEGHYALLQLQPGTYTLRTEFQGFKKLERTGVVVQVGDRLPINLSLEVGASTESVSVVGDAPLVRTEDAQTGEVINNIMIQSLPQLDRDPLALIRLAGNVQGGRNDDGTLQDRATSGSTLRINGGRTQGIDYFVDGVTVGTGMAHDVSYNTPTTEAVQEFRVITNGISAEYGRISGGAVELVTKSGTNRIHGQLFEYDKNRVFNANSWRNNKEGKGKDNFQENDYGGAVGGPISIPKVYNGKDKSFFFFNYEGYKYRQGGALQYGSVPTQAMRNGDFQNVCLNGTCVKLYDQNGPVAQEADGKFYRQNLLNDGYHILPSQINPVAAAALKFVPLPNHAPDPGTTFQNNYVGTSNISTNRYDWAVRIDQNLTANQKFFARFTTHNYVNDPGSRWFGAGQAISENQNKGMWAQSVNYAWTVSPTLIFNLRAGVNHTPFTSGSKIDPAVTQSIPFDAVTKALVGSAGSVQLWAPNMTPMIDSATTNVTNATTYDVNLAMVKTLNKHMLRFGYEHRRYYDNFTNGSSAYMLTTGRTVKRGAFDSGWNDEDFVDSFAGFLQGYISHQGAFGAKTRAMNFNYNAAYLQDEFRVSQKLTVGLGLRWDMETPVTERSDKLYFWDPNAPSPFTVKPGYNFNTELLKGLAAANLSPSLASSIPVPDWAKNGFPTGAARIANSPEFKSRTGTGYNPFQFSPRISVAYSSSPRTVFRGSFGKMYLSRSGDANALSTAGGAMALSDSYGELWHVNDPSVPYYKMSQTLSDPFRPQDLKHYTRDNFAANSQVTGGDPTLIAYSTTSHMPHEYTWNATVQRQLTNNMVVEAGYVGNKGSDLLSQDLISRFPASQFVPANATVYNTVQIANPVAQTINFPAMFPLPIAEYRYPYFGPVSLQGLNYGRSLYNGLTFRFERRMSNGVAFLVNYTLSRVDDNVGGPNTNNGGIVSSGTGTHPPQSVQSVKDVYGISPIDQTHLIRAYYQIELPFGRGRKWLNSTSSIGGKVLDWIAGGWETAGISSWSSGVPIMIPGSNANNKPSRVEYVWSSYATSNHDLSSPTYQGQSSVFYSQAVPPSVRQTGPRRLDPSRVINPDQAGSVPFQLGNINPIYGGVRQPWGIYHDLSLMKKFNIRESMFLQVRAEAENVFNMRGFPQFITDPRNSDYGLMIAENGFNHQPRKLQLSARFIF